MAEFMVIPGSDGSKWSAELEKLDAVDVYYLHSYVTMVEANGDGNAHLIVFRHSLGTVVQPVLMRPIILCGADTGYTDMISPYGYSGPWLTASGRHSLELARAYVEALNSYCRKHYIVSELVRFHPLLSNHKSLAPHIPVACVGETVYVDLCKPMEELFRTDFTGRVRNDVRRAQREGVEVVFGHEADMVETFRRLYLITMERVGASQYYFFADAFFESLAALVVHHGVIAEARLRNRVIASTILLHGPRYLHYHLSGSDPSFRHVPSTSLILYEAIQWGRAKGLTHFHLGGGLGGANDGLFRFKSGFSRLRSRYMLGRVVHIPEVYDELVKKRFGTEGLLEGNRSGFFPAYRLP